MLPENSTFQNVCSTDGRHQNWRMLQVAVILMMWCLISLKRQGGAGYRALKNPLCHLGTHSSAFKASLLHIQQPKMCRYLNRSWFLLRNNLGNLWYQRIYEKNPRVSHENWWIRCSWGFTRECRNLLRPLLIFKTNFNHPLNHPKSKCIFPFLTSGICCYSDIVWPLPAFYRSWLLLSNRHVIIICFLLIKSFTYLTLIMIDALLCHTSRVVCAPRASLPSIHDLSVFWNLLLACSCCDPVLFGQIPTGGDEWRISRMKPWQLRLTCVWVLFHHFTDSGRWNNQEF